MSLPRFWPESYQCAATITVNFDGESLDQQNSPLPLWGRHSYGRYGAQAGVQRLLDLFDRYDITATFFIPGWDAERYPTVMAAIKDAGHEVAGHGYLHEDFSRLSLAEQERILEQSETSLLHVFGEKPVGWRAPDGLMTKETRALLARRGYRYDSSYADDDLPYVADDGQDHRIAELPISTIRVRTSSITRSTACRMWWHRHFETSSAPPMLRAACSTWRYILVVMWDRVGRCECAPSSRCFKPCASTLRCGSPPAARSPTGPSTRIADKCLISVFHEARFR